MGGVSGFELSKWYADCVSGDGQTIIAYVATLLWQGLHLDYSSILSTTAAGMTESAGSILHVAPPSIDKQAFRWRSRTLDFEGCWTPTQRAIRETIYSSSSGIVEWECLQPLADVKITFGNRLIAGLGYVERVRMTAPPWTLPIDRLSWGRFLCPGQSVIWIGWRGAYCTQHIWVNGEPRRGTIQDHNLILEPDSTLDLRSSVILRDGALGKTVLAILPHWIKPLPGRVLGIQETKWRSRGQFAAPGEARIEGWAIHEVVQWPK